MPVIERQQLAATTPASKWWIDVATPAANPTWVGLFGVTSFTPGTSQNLQDDSDFDGAGWGSQTNTRNDWAPSGTIKRAPQPNSDPPVYDPGQELVRLAGEATGADNELLVRYYEMAPGGPRVEAYQGRAAVSYSEDGGDTTGLSTASFTFTGRGLRERITHPSAVV